DAVGGAHVEDDRPRAGELAQVRHSVDVRNLAEGGAAVAPGLQVSSSGRLDGRKSVADDLDILAVQRAESVEFGALQHGEVGVAIIQGLDVQLGDLFGAVVEVQLVAEHTKFLAVERDLFDVLAVLNLEVNHHIAVGTFGDRLLPLGVGLKIGDLGP